MKKIILIAVFAFGFVTANAQVDVITKHNSEIVKGQMVNLEESRVIDKYDGENA